MTPAKLSRSDRAFLRHLVFRQAHPAGELSWITPEPRGRWRLFVFTMMGTYAPSPFAKNAATLARLEAAGYLHRGPKAPLPQPYAARQGHTLRLTTQGYRAADATPPAHR